MFCKCIGENLGIILGGKKALALALNNFWCSGLLMFSEQLLIPLKPSGCQGHNFYSADPLVSSQKEISYQFLSTGIRHIIPMQCLSP